MTVLIIDGGRFTMEIEMPAIRQCRKQTEKRREERATVMTWMTRKGFRDGAKITCKNMFVGIAQLAAGVPTAPKVPCCPSECSTL